MNGIKSEGNCYLWIPPYKYQTKDLTQFNQVLTLENNKCDSQSECETRDTLVGNRLSRHMMRE
jgi:hypothetical protein